MITGMLHGKTRLASEPDFRAYNHLIYEVRSSCDPDRN
jgi:hypothetical protein